MILSHLICAIVSGFIGAFPVEAEQVETFCRENRREIASGLPYLTSEERLMAISLVAPEMSQFSEFCDFIELRSLYAVYVNTGKSDFSVGLFQMKPSFVEELENQIRHDKKLKDRYSCLLPKGSKREQRRSRLSNLSCLSGQLKYLEVFVEIARNRTKDLSFQGDADRLRYWATLYNSGFQRSEDEIRCLQQIKMFPRFTRQFNYSDVCVEFYNKLKAYAW